MIETKPASQLEKGDVFSTDGYVVQSAVALHDGTNRISVELWLDASGGINKRAVLDADFPCPIWTEDDGPTDDEIYNRHGVEGGIGYDADDVPGSLGENDWRL